MEMKTGQLDSVDAAASVKAPGRSINTEVENLAKKASKAIKMDGFRPGKIPVSAVLKRYEKELGNDAEQNLPKNAIDSALKELKRDLKELVGEPYFEKFERENDAIIAELVLSSKPELKLDGYEKCTPEFSIPKVSKKEIDEKKNELLKRYATTEVVKTRGALKEGDYAKFDSEGFIGGKAFDGGKAENYAFEISSKQSVPGLEEAVVGVKSGEEKNISVTFPKEYGATNLVGKDATFKIKLHEIQELKLPELNEEPLEKLLPNEEKASEELLDEKLKEQTKNEKLFKLINEELEAKFADSLIEAFGFDLPKGILEQEIDMQFRQAFGAFSEEEKKEIQNDKDKYEAKRNGFKDEAEKSVKLTFIIDELAKLRKIGVSDQELVQAVYFEAYYYGFNPKEHLENYKKQGVLPAVKMVLIEDKFFNDIFMPKEKAKKEEKEDK